MIDGLRPSLGTELLNIMDDHIVVLCVRCHHQSRLCDFTHTCHDLGIVRKRQTDKLSFASGRSLMQERFVCNDPFLRQRNDFFGILSAGSTVKGIVHNAVICGNPFSIIKDFLIVLRWSGDRMLKNRRASALSSRQRSGVKGFTIRMTRISDMDMRINAAGGHIFPLRFNASHRIPVSEKSALSNRCDLSVFYRNIALSKVSVYISKTILNQ